MDFTEDYVWKLRARSWLYSHVEDQDLCLYYQEASDFVNALADFAPVAHYLREAMVEVFSEDPRNLYVYYDGGPGGQEDATGPFLCSCMADFVSTATHDLRNRLQGKEYEIQCVHLHTDGEGYGNGAWVLEFNVYFHDADRKFFRYYTQVEVDETDDPFAPPAEDQATEIVYAERLSDIISELNSKEDDND